MSVSDWGNATWYMMHTLAAKLKPDNNVFVPVLFNQFRYVCSNLPCPECSEHAARMFATANISAVVDKDSLIRFLNALHNRVNNRLQKPEVNLNDCIEKYDKFDLSAVLFHYFNTLLNIRSQDQAMINGFTMKRCVNNFRIFILENKDAFIRQH